MRHLLHVCTSWERDPSSEAHLASEGFFFFRYDKIFLTGIKGLRTEDTDCKAN